VVYIVGSFGAMSELELPWPREEDGRAGPDETSMLLALRPDLVDITRQVFDLMWICARQVLVMKGREPLRCR
jgi:hypothetical protein